MSECYQRKNLREFHCIPEGRPDNGMHPTRISKGVTLKIGGCSQFSTGG